MEQKEERGRPESCSDLYEVELSLQEGHHWLGTYPVNKETLVNWMKTRPHRKRALQRALTNAKDNEEILKVTAEFNTKVEKIAEGLLAQVTRGSHHEGQDSPIKSEHRFKRTRTQSLCIGAGAIIGALKDAAADLHDAPHLKRFISGGKEPRVWVTPGKIVIYRYFNGSYRKPLRVPDGRHERNLPPIAPSPLNMFRGRPSTIVWAERIDPPAYLHFWLWVNPDITMQDISTWLEVAAETGIGGFRQGGMGQFEIVIFEPASEQARQRLLERERRKREFNEEQFLELTKGR